MSKLEYDNFFKFIVSIGIALCTLSVLAVCFFLQENSILLISEEELSHLTEAARQTVERKQRLAYTLANNNLVIGGAVISFITGMIMVILGCVKWRPRQKILDEKEEVELQTKKLELQKATPEERKEKADREMLENVGIIQPTNNQLDKTSSDDPSGKALSVEEIREKQDVVRAENRIIYNQISRRYRCVEDAVVSQIRSCLNSTHGTQTDVKAGNCVLDVVAVSNGKLPDYIFEIKYLFSASSWNSERWNLNTYRIQQQLTAYYEETGRTATPILIIVTPEDQRDRVEAMAKKMLSNATFDIKVISEKEIGIEDT